MDISSVFQHIDFWLADVSIVCCLSGEDLGIMVCYNFEEFEILRIYGTFSSHKMAEIRPGT